jgi:N-acetyl-beta-hexosaminidase
MVEAFEPLDMFHMGGDEVNLNCWNTSQEVRDYFDAQGQVYLTLYSHKLRASEHVQEVRGYFDAQGQVYRTL